MIRNKRFNQQFPERFPRTFWYQVPTDTTVTARKARVNHFVPLRVTYSRS
jgi:hypothetical protein